MKRMLPILLILSALSPALSAHTITGLVTRVIDGDTVMLRITEVRRQRTDVRIRLAGIDAPELHQPYGIEAKRALADLVLSNTVVVTWKQTDRDRRIIGTVMPAGGRASSANEELVRYGHAWHYLRYSKNPALTEIQRGARSDRVGLWASGTAIPPWEFRKQRKERSRTCQN